jgi:acyl-CoA thioesterase
MNASETPLDPERIGRWLEQNDRLARLLGMRVEEVGPGHCRVSMRVTADMLNAVGLTHGGVTYSLADFAFAVASNSHGTVAVALTAQMSYPAASREGDLLLADARENNLGGKTALYTVEVRTAEGKLVGLFSGTVFRRGEPVREWMKTH